LKRKEKNQEITTYEKGTKSIQRYSYDKKKKKKIIMIDLPSRYGKVCD